MVKTDRCNDVKIPIWGRGVSKNEKNISDVFYKRSLRSSQLPLELLFEWALSVDSIDHPDFKWFSGKVSNPKDKR